ncbi:hypothetical protein I3760_04G116500 [Carya illinoinensis]|nr:hypothetical protein I3760_04G116500 [Carya illinoinensis]
MESQDPFVDFRKSMEEMVEAHGMKEWEGFEELLCWYLRLNGKSSTGILLVLLLICWLALHLHRLLLVVLPILLLLLYLLYFFSSSSSSTRCISSMEADQEDSDVCPCLSLLLEGQGGIGKKKKVIVHL